MQAVTANRDRALIRLFPCGNDLFYNRKSAPPGRCPGMTTGGDDHGPAMLGWMTKNRDELWIL